LAANFISSGSGTWAPIETQHRRRWSLFQITKSAVVGRQDGMRPADSSCSLGGSGRLNAADAERPCREFLFQTSLLISRKAWHGTSQQAAQGRDSSALSGDMRSQWRSNTGGVLWMSSTLHASTEGRPACWLLRQQSPQHQELGQPVRTNSTPRPCLHNLPDSVRSASRHWPGRSSVNLVIGEDDPMPTDHFSLDYGIGERMAPLEHLDRDGMAAVLRGLPAVRFRLWSRFLFWFVLFCHVPSTKRKVRLEARHERQDTTGLPLPPLRSTANHPSR
jgi:hypothetical protein